VRVASTSFSPRRRNVDGASACAVDRKWGADGFVTKLPPAGVLTGIKILPYKKRPTDPRKRVLYTPVSDVFMDCARVFVMLPA